MRGSLAGGCLFCEAGAVQTDGTGLFCPVRALAVIELILQEREEMVGKKFFQIHQGEAMAVVFGQIRRGDQKIQLSGRDIGHDLSLACRVIVKRGTRLYIEAVVKDHLLIRSQFQLCGEIPGDGSGRKQIFIVIGEEAFQNCLPAGLQPGIPDKKACKAQAQKDKRIPSVIIQDKPDLLPEGESLKCLSVLDKTLSDLI